MKVTLIGAETYALGSKVFQRGVATTVSSEDGQYLLALRSPQDLEYFSLDGKATPKKVEAKISYVTKVPLAGEAKEEEGDDEAFEAELDAKLDEEEEEEGEEEESPDVTVADLNPKKSTGKTSKVVGAAKTAKPAKALGKVTIKKGPKKADVPVEQLRPAEDNTQDEADVTI